eukprot:TRINITY_DN6538_c0_g1_i1.p1 TRINITY_DN6538_c0_g1~~TRINITY_DN6538_c0_g1_i1.p1  ORF type:complete len:166 (-),score=18.64 TRINITY_DN6538_c0_g1_i1:50-547(-)
MCIRDRREDPHKINGKIDVPEVRLVGEGIEPGVYPIRKALELADDQGLDLVEISPNAAPPVCKILDYKKFLFEQKKKQKELKSKATKIVVKEIRFGPNTDDHDFEFKLKHAQQFLEQGCKVRAFVFFRGRSIAVSYTHLRAHETVLDLVCRLLLEKKKNSKHYTM